MDPRCYMRGHALIVLAAGLLLAADASKDSQADKDKLQGKWQMASLETNGEKAPEEKLKDFQLTVKDDSYEVHIGERVVKLRIKLDPSKKPKAIDLTYADGP